MSTPFRSALLAILILLAPRPVFGQTTLLSETPTCSACAIRYEAQVFLGDLDDPASPGPKE